MNWGVGDFQFLKSGSDEPCIQPIESSSTPPRHRARCTHLQTQPGRIQPIDSSHLASMPAWRRTSRCLRLAVLVSPLCASMCRKCLRVFQGRMGGRRRAAARHGRRAPAPRCSNG
ncbi:hypothetical protein L552_1659 [Bordetella pertussis I002]|nr:hypothetical protein L552_1659 [Bordetella pertussis I002]